MSLVFGKLSWGDDRLDRVNLPPPPLSLIPFFVILYSFVLVVGSLISFLKSFLSIGTSLCWIIVLKLLSFLYLLKYTSKLSFPFTEPNISPTFWEGVNLSQAANSLL